MAGWLPLALLIAAGMLLALVTWRRSHPNHLFIFSLCEWLAARQEGRPELTQLSSRCNPPLTTPNYKENARRAVR